MTPVLQLLIISAIGRNEPLYQIEIGSIIYSFRRLNYLNLLLNKCFVGFLPCLSSYSESMILYVDFQFLLPDIVLRCSWKCFYSFFSFYYFFPFSGHVPHLQKPASLVPFWMRLSQPTSVDLPSLCQYQMMKIKLMQVRPLQQRLPPVSILITIDHN